MAIDDGAVVDLPYASCIPNGCIVGVNLDDEQLAALKRGGEARFTFQDGRRRSITVPVSLQGFTAAIDSISP
jgi:invasion protein IalB